MSTRIIPVPFCDGSEYVLFPACAYNGNRFDVIPRDYPPMFYPDEARKDMPVTITDVPRLEKDGTGRLEVTTGDVSVPCVGVFSQAARQAVLVYAVQQVAGHNLGLAYERGQIILTCPAHRRQVYRWPHMVENHAPYHDIPAEIPVHVHAFSCDSMERFYEVFFENRKCMQLDAALPDVLPPAAQFAIQREKFNTMNWQEGLGYYDLDALGGWQPGWVGGAMSSYPLMLLGDALERERGVRTLQHLFANQAPSGLFHGLLDGVNDGFRVPGAEKWVLIRKSADCLYFLFKHFAIMETVPESFEARTRRLADAFVRLWHREGQFGQFIDCDTGEIAVGGSTSGAIIPAGLAVASVYFDEPEYMSVAQEGARQLYARDALAGYTTGGPGEILQCPDSESAFSLLESMVVLYEITGEAEWLAKARHVANLCSSWVVAYNYVFPSGSEFARLAMKTVGSVFANVQNKHAAPGICTLSGDSLRKLAEWTGEPLYMALYHDITRTISQYMSTDARPIYAWDVPKDATALGIADQRVPRERLPQGFICERVNMSDWETDRCVGGVFNGSCWGETSNLLVLAECTDGTHWR